MYINIFLFCHTRRNANGKSPFELNALYRCMHNTRYERTSDMEAVQRSNPSKQRSKNTGCQFMMKIQVLKNVSFHIAFHLVMRFSNSNMYKYEQ